MLFLRAFGVWLAILALAIINGGFREALLIPRLGVQSAQLLSGSILIICILGVSYFLVPLIRPASRQQLVQIGVFWIVLTLVFEFGFGRFVQGRSWAELIGAYTFRGGNLWPVVLVATMLAPLLVGRRVIQSNGGGKSSGR